MENLLYFPTFEPPTNNWLKFAILYMENFSPIIPQSGRNQLSAGFNLILDETDLIRPYEPNFNASRAASLKAIEFVDKMRDHPHRYDPLFNRVNLMTVLTDPTRRTAKIYQEKFSGNWADYCISNGYSTETDGGILVSEELAFLYMTFLAEEIAYEERMSVITDNNSFDNFLNYKRAIPQNIAARHRFAQGVLGLALPRNISEIPVERLIRFRNEKRHLIRAFNQALDETLNNVQNGVTERQFINRFKDIYSEFTSEIIGLGLGIVTIPLAAYILFHNREATTPEYVKEIIGGLGIMITTKIALQDRWRELQTHHQCRNYLTNISSLNH